MEKKNSDEINKDPLQHFNPMINDCHYIKVYCSDIMCSYQQFTMTVCTVIHSTADNKTQKCDILLIMSLLFVNNNNNQIEYSEGKKVEAKAT